MKNLDLLLGIMEIIENQKIGKNDQKSIEIKLLIFCLLLVFLCTQKVRALQNRSVCPAVRLHDKASRANPIVMKFCAQNRLIDISVEFKDENDWSTPSWFIAENVIIPVGLLHGVSHKKTTSVSESTEKHPILQSLKSCICGKKISHQYRSFGKIQVSQFQLEILKILKNQKTLQNLWASIFSYYMVKNEFQIYILVLHELTHSPTCFFLFCICIKKHFFGTH